MIRNIVRATLAVVVLAVLTGLVYPLVMTGFAQIALAGKANGSIVKVDGKAVGSSMIGQAWKGAAVVLRPAIGHRQRRLHLEREQPGPVVPGTGRRDQGTGQGDHLGGGSVPLRPHHGADPGRPADGLVERPRPGHHPRGRGVPGPPDRRGPSPPAVHGDGADPRSHDQRDARLPRAAAGERPRAEPGPAGGRRGSDRPGLHAAAAGVRARRARPDRRDGACPGKRSNREARSS